MTTFLDDPFITYSNNHEITVGSIAPRSSFLIFQNNYIVNPPFQDGVAPDALVDSVIDVPNSFPLGICRCLNDNEENQVKCNHKQLGLSLFDMINTNNHHSLKRKRETQNHNNILTSTRSSPVITNCHNPSHQNNNSSNNILRFNININSVTMHSPRIYISDDPWETQSPYNHDNKTDNNHEDGRFLTDLFETVTNERVVIPSNSYNYDSDMNTNTNCDAVDYNYNYDSDINTDTNCVAVDLPKIYIGGNLWETQPLYNHQNGTNEGGLFSTETTNKRVVIPSDPWAMDKLGTINMSAANDETRPTIVGRYDFSDKKKESSLLIIDSDANTNTNITEVDGSGFDMWMEEKLSYCDNSEEKSSAIKDGYGDIIYNDDEDDDGDGDDDDDDDDDDDGDDNYSFATPPEATFETFDNISLLTYGSFNEDEISTTSEDENKNRYIEIMDYLSGMKENENFVVLHRFPVDEDGEGYLDQKVQDLNVVDITFVVSSNQKDEKEEDDDDDDDDENGNKFRRFLTPLFLD